jgi:hypothetical protein
MTVVNNVFFAAPEYGKTTPKKRVTATELIDGVRCVITLERDKSGYYREVRLDPVGKVSNDERHTLKSSN